MSDKRFESSKSESPHKFVPLLAIGAGLSLASGAIGSWQANKQQRKAERKEKQSRKEMNRLKDIYSNLDTSNPYLNMENTMEDLTVNQQQAQFQQQQFQQSQANIMDSLKGAAGGGGVAALAQQLAQSGQLASQQASASIGQQEAANQRAERAAAGRIQDMERQGELISREQEKDKQSTLLNMSQMETSAYMQQGQQAEQAKWDAISSGVSNVASFAGADGTFGFGG